MVINPYDKVLDDKGLKYEDLRPEEKELYRQASKGVESVNVDDLHQKFSEILFSLILELCDTPSTTEFRDKNAYLKASVKHYATAVAFLDRPYKVAKAIEKSIENTPIKV